MFSVTSTIQAIATFCGWRCQVGHSGSGRVRAPCLRSPVLPIKGALPCKRRKAIRWVCPATVVEVKRFLKTLRPQCERKPLNRGQRWPLKGDPTLQPRASPADTPSFFSPSFCCAFVSLSATFFYVAKLGPAVHKLVSRSIAFLSTAGDLNKIGRPFDSSPLVSPWINISPVTKPAGHERSCCRRREKLPAFSEQKKWWG